MRTIYSRCMPLNVDLPSRGEVIAEVAEIIDWVKRLTGTSSDEVICGIFGYAVAARDYRGLCGFVIPYIHVADGNMVLRRIEVDENCRRVFGGEHIILLDGLRSIVLIQVSAIASETITAYGSCNVLRALRWLGYNCIHAGVYEPEVG